MSSAKITPAQLHAELQRFDYRGRLGRLRHALHRAGHHPHVDTALILALASRETNLSNIVGDGGHGRGLVQIDDRYHAPWLASVAGCQSGSYRRRYRSALPAGRVPGLAAQVALTVAMLEQGVAAAIAAGVPAGHRLHVAVAGYNAGMAGALGALHSHGDPDAATTGHDYGADVLARRTILLTHLGVH